MNCKFKKSNGDNCKNLSLKSDKYCYWHSKKIPEDEKKLNRSNGGKNKVIKVNSEFEHYELNNISDVIKLNTVMINRVLNNELDLRIATGITYMLNLQIKGIELNTIEKRIDIIEQVNIRIINDRKDLLND